MTNVKYDKIMGRIREQDQGVPGPQGPQGPAGQNGQDAYNPFKGWYESEEELRENCPNPIVGDYAYVMTEEGIYKNDVIIYDCQVAATWHNSGIVFQPDNVGDAILYSPQNNLTNSQRTQALANVSNQTAGYDASDPPVFTGKMGYKVLQPGASFASQVTEPNTIYEIRDVFDLNGGSFTIPANCTLSFNGGLLKNGYVDFNYCVVEQNQDDAIFGDNLLPTFNSHLHQYILPEWFGAKGDGTTDDTVALERCINFAREIYNNRGEGEDIYKPKIRQYYRAFCTIFSERNNVFIVRRPLWIDFQCDIKGGFGIAYQGDYLDDGVGIVNFYGVLSYSTFEFRVWHSKKNPSSSATFYPDWNEGKTIGIALGSSTHPIFAEFVDFKVSVMKCYIGVRCYGHNGQNTCTGMRFVNCIFSQCMFGIESTNNTGSWNNCFRFKDNEYRLTNGVTLDTSMETAAFIKIDGAEPIMNASIVDGLYLEGNLQEKGKALIFYDNDVYVTQAGLSIKNIRIESTGRGLIYAKNNMLFYKCIIDSCFSVGTKIATIQIKGVTFDANYIDLPGFTVLGIEKNRHKTIQISEDIFNKTYGNKQYFYIRDPACVFGYYTYASNPKIDTIKTKSSGYDIKYCIKLRPKQVIELCAKSYNQAAVLTQTLDDSLAKITTIDSGVNIVADNSRRYNDYAYTQDGVGDSRLKNFIYLYNTSESVRYIMCSSNIALYEIKGDNVETYNNDYYKTTGSTSERPTLTSDDASAEYFDTTINKKVIWNGSVWVFENGYTSEITSGTTQDRPTLVSTDAGFQFFDTTLGKYICWNGNAWVNLDGTPLS